MKKRIQKLLAFLMIMSFTIITNAAIKNDRLELKNGKTSVRINLKPGESKQFVISGKQFKTLKLSMKTSNKNLHIEVISPKSKTLASGKRKSFTVKNVGSGDYRINLKNRDKSEIAKGYIQIGSVEG